MGNKINTNSNAYILAYASGLVVVVAFLLASIYMCLKDRIDANVEMDKKSQILASLNIRDLEKDEIVSKYGSIVELDKIINVKGEDVASGSQKDQDGFKLSSKEVNDDNLPLYVCSISGSTKYVIPLSGKGLWGPIGGYVALNDDKKTIYGVFFNHESETAGLGALITEEFFQKQFVGKTAYDGNDNFVNVVKEGKVNPKNESMECDGISGATKTSVAVGKMFNESLTKYKAFLNK